MIRRLESVDRDGRFSLNDLVSPNAVNDLAQFFDFEASGWSMYPALQTGDRIELAPVRDLRRGDLMVFREQARFICHRVAAAVEDGRVRTQSDSGIGGAHSVPLEDVVGTVAAVVRGRRRFEPSRVARPPGSIVRAWIAMNHRAERLAALERHVLFRLFRHARRRAWFRTLCARVLARRVKVSTAVRGFHRRDVLLVARVAGRCVGTLDRASGAYWVHPLFDDLGIEDILSR